MRDYTDSPKIYARDLDGSGSMHICSREDEGAVEFTRTPPRQFWIVNYDATAWGTKEQADAHAAKHDSLVHHVQQLSEY